MSKNISAEMVSRCRNAVRRLTTMAECSDDPERATALKGMAFAVAWLINDHSAISAAMDEIDRAEKEKP